MLNGGASSSRIHAVVLDRYEDFASVVVELFRVRGHAAKHVGSGAAALAVLAKEAVDVVILDVDDVELEPFVFLRTLDERLGTAAPTCVGLRGLTHGWKLRPAADAAKLFVVWSKVDLPHDAIAQIEREVRRTFGARGRRG